MDQIALNFEALGVSGILVAFLFYIYMQAKAETKSAQEKTDTWQNKAFQLQQDNQEQLYEALKTIDKVMDVLER